MSAPVTWDSLNKRQRTYLLAVYEVDQDNEEYMRWRGARGYWNSTPASVWRWIAYNAADAPLLRKIEKAGYRDPGTGSTFEALALRGLILRKWEPDPFGFPILFVQITRAGRKLVRENLGIQSVKKPPVGTLKEWHWKALCRAYVRGEEGMGYDQDTGDGFGYVSWRTCLRLRDYTVKGQEQELIREGRRDEHFSLVITEFGKAYYQEHWQWYRELYPEVDAPEPQKVEE